MKGDIIRDPDTFNIGGSAHVQFGDNQFFLQGDTPEQRCLWALKTSAYESFKNANIKRVPGTCEWAFSHPHFQTWQASDQNELLWITADPGCGKSVLSRSFVDETSEQGKHTLCYFFFKDNGSQDSLDVALSAILHQLFSDQPDLLRHAIPSWKRRNLSEVSEMWRVFIASTRVAAKQIICVIDALDECKDTDRRHLISLLCKFCRSKSAGVSQQPLKFLLTSRPYDNVQRWFSSLQHEIPEIRLRGEEENDSIAKEINLVAAQHVRSLSIEFRLSSHTQEQLHNSLCEMKQRTYLWLYLAIDTIRNKFRFSRRRQNINHMALLLPQNVEEAYEQLLNRTDPCQKQNVERVLMLVVGARRPWSSRQLFIAMSYDDPEGMATAADEFDQITFQAQLRDWCGLFVFISHDKLFLIHQTAKEFLLARTPRIDTTLHQWKGSLTINRIETELARVCIALFCQQDMQKMVARQERHAWDEFKRQYNLRQPDPYNGYRHSDLNLNGLTNDHDTLDIELEKFCAYCIDHWAHHVESSNLLDDFDYCAKLFSMLDGEGALLRHWASVFASYRLGPSWSSHTRAQHVLAAQGYRVALECLDKGGTLAWDACDGSGNTALMHAVRHGHLDVVSCLVAIGADINALSGPIDNIQDYEKYSVPMDNSLGGVFQNFGLQMNPASSLSEQTVIKQRFSALHIACELGNTQVAELLLERGANPSACMNSGYYKYTPIELAVKSGNQALVELFCGKWAGDLDGALLLAMKRGQQDILDLLTRSGAKNLDQVLYKACEQGKIQMAQSLLNAGANINGPESGQTADSPLSAAIACGRKLMAQFLIKSGADINTERQLPGRALSNAVLAHNKDLVKLLLNAGAKIDMPAGRRGDCILCFAVAREIPLNREEIVTLLLEANAEVYHHGTQHSCAGPLVVAAKLGRLSAVELLLDHIKVHTDTHLVKELINTAVLAAIDAAQHDVVKFFLSSASDDISETAAHKALAVVAAWERYRKLCERSYVHPYLLIPITSKNFRNKKNLTIWSQVVTENTTPSLIIYLRSRLRDTRITIPIPSVNDGGRPRSAIHLVVTGWGEMLGDPTHPDFQLPT